MIRLTLSQFNVMKCLLSDEGTSQRKISKFCEMSLGKVNSILKELKANNFIDDDYKITKQGYTVLKQYKVKNAVILAAGMSEHFMSLSIDKPKALLKVKGEVLIERQIRQLREAGIDEIYVVVGYMMEQFFYLEELFHVHIIINHEYKERSSIGSIEKVKHILGNTYICPSDVYYNENVFEPYVYHSYYASVFQYGTTREAYVKYDDHDRIQDVYRKGYNDWILYGHAFLSDDFSRQYIHLLNERYNQIEVKKMYWEELFYPHLKTLEIYLKKYDSGIIFEFDTLEELKLFDEQFIENLDFDIFNNIAKALNCKKNEISNFEFHSKEPSKYSLVFEVGGTQYLYKVSHDYLKEEYHMIFEDMHKKGLYPNYIYSDKSGNIVEKFVCSYFNANIDFIRGKEYLDSVHQYNHNALKHYDYIEKMKSLLLKCDLSQYRYNYFMPYINKIEEIAENLKNDKWDYKFCMNHIVQSDMNMYDNKLYINNFDYAGINDIGYDIASYCGILADQGILTREMIERYYERKVTDHEYIHIMGCYCVIKCFDFFMALYLENYGYNMSTSLYDNYKKMEASYNIVKKSYK